MSDLTVFTFKDKKFSVLASKNWLGLSSDEENDKTEEKDTEKPNVLTLEKIQNDKVGLCKSFTFSLNFSFQVNFLFLVRSKFNNS